MTPDCVFYSDEGKRRTLKEWQLAFHEQLPCLLRTRTRVVFTSVRGACADVHTACEQRYKNMHIEGTARTNLVVRATSVDHWIKSAQGWRMQCSQQKSVEMELVD